MELCGARADIARWKNSAAIISHCDKHSILAQNVSHIPRMCILAATDTKQKFANLATAANEFLLSLLATSGSSRSSHDSAEVTALTPISSAVREVHAVVRVICRHCLSRCEWYRNAVTTFRAFRYWRQISLRWAVGEQNVREYMHIKVAWKINSAVRI